MPVQSRSRRAPVVVIAALVLGAAGQATRVVGRQPDGSIVASDNQLLTPAGTIVQLGSPVRAKAVAVNPNTSTRTAVVLLMKAAEPVVVFDTTTGAVLQRFRPAARTAGGPTGTSGSIAGIAYSADGSRLLFSQDASGGQSGGAVSVANVDPVHGLLTPDATISLPVLSGISHPFHANAVVPAGLAIAADGATALVALNAQNSVGVVDLPGRALIAQVQVGNAPNQIAIVGDTAFVTDEGGRRAAPGEFTSLSDGTPIVADAADAYATTGTVSVIDLKTRAMVRTIGVGLHPAGITAAGGMLYVANAYSDTVSVIDAKTRALTATIGVHVPVHGGAFGAGPNDVAVVGSTAYVTLGECNAVAVVDLATGKVAGYIPTLYFPTSIAYDAGTRQLVIANDKGLGAQGSLRSVHGVRGFNTHQDSGAVSLVKPPDPAQLAAYTRQVMDNNHWSTADAEVTANVADARAAPVAIPRHTGEPSLIRHVFLIIKENRTYDQMLGDLPQGNGDPSLAVFAPMVPNQHALVRRFPLLDNVYAPSRQSADGHPWIVEAGSFYSNDILAPDWIRSYPGGNSDDALTYTQRGFLWSAALRAHLSVRMYGEWSAGFTVAAKPGGGAYSWADFYNTTLYNETGGRRGANIVPPDADTEQATIPSVAAVLDLHYPSFNLGIPDQYRADYYISALNAQVARNAVPNLTIIWLPNDHTNATTDGFPLPANYQADNDLALGRIVDAISHSSAWPSSAIFVEEDDAQDGVDHVDGHRQPVYVISPYTVPPQSPGVGRVIHTTYTQENIDRTIENILGLPSLTQFDLTAEPMFDVFGNTPDNSPFTQIAATTPFNIGPGGVPIAGTQGAQHTLNTHTMSPLEKAWTLASDEMTKGHAGQADSVDEDFLNHAIWYSATGWTRAYPSETAVVSPMKFMARK